MTTLTAPKTMTFKLVGRGLRSEQSNTQVLDRDER
jgi:hypothetical protein